LELLMLVMMSRSKSLEERKAAKRARREAKERSIAAAAPTATALNVASGAALPVSAVLPALTAVAVKGAAGEYVEAAPAKRARTSEDGRAAAASAAEALQRCDEAIDLCEEPEAPEGAETKEAKQRRLLKAKRVAKRTGAREMREALEEQKAQRLQQQVQQRKAGVDVDSSATCAPRNITNGYTAPAQRGASALDDPAATAAAPAQPASKNASNGMAEQERSNGKAARLASNGSLPLQTDAVEGASLRLGTRAATAQARAAKRKAPGLPVKLGNGVANSGTAVSKTAAHAAESTRDSNANGQGKGCATASFAGGYVQARNGTDSVSSGAKAPAAAPAIAAAKGDGEAYKDYKDWFEKKHGITGLNEKMPLMQARAGLLRLHPVAHQASDSPGSSRMQRAADTLSTRLHCVNAHSICL
jgi:hypothetical protein